MFTSPLLKRIATVLAALHILLVAQIHGAGCHDRNAGGRRASAASRRSSC